MVTGWRKLNVRARVEMYTNFVFSNDFYFSFVIIYLFNLYKNYNYMAAPQSDPVTLSAFEASKRLTIKFTK